MAEMRVHRALAQAGVASRRAAEKLVAEGRVTVNGDIAVVGQVVRDSDVIALDGRRVQAEPIRTYMLNKPMGVVSTASDPEGRPTVLDGLPDDVRLYPIGRLDIDTTGLLLITNDGDLAHRLMHPRSKVPKTYEALVDGRVSSTSVRALRNGIELDDGPTQPARVEVLDRQAPGGTWLRIEITEGRNRQVRRMCEALGHRVRRLVRTRYGGLGLGRLQRGEHRLLTSAELARLATQAGMAR
ncbi:MAG: pseudouridine synthase [Miltoncostaeaceae bacterium]|jgi:pseudouridine synthase